MTPNTKERILVVDDSADTLEVIQRNLAGRGHPVQTALSVEEALKVLEGLAIDLVITDLKMPRVSGLELIRHIRENCADTEVMMITGYASVGGAVEAVKTGAEEYLSKPFTDSELFSAVDRVLEKLRLRRVALGCRQKKGNAPPQGLIGQSEPMHKVCRDIAKAALTSATVLIFGESGTGKELLARAIHYSSQRATSPFVPVNCGGIPEGLMESELFGHLKGSFTGASESRAGFFQTADGGTIFLDEISETSLSMQVKLLRVLQDREVCMVGASRTRKVDIRIIAATNKDLFGLVKKGSFRDDLYFRLNVIAISIPPLRERGDDILLLVEHFCEKFATEFGRRRPRFSARAMRALCSYGWPGNVRELENLIQRVVVMCDKEEIDVSDFPDTMRYLLPRDQRIERTLAQVEAEHVRAVIEAVDGNKTLAAQMLGIDRKTLREKMKRHEIDSPEF